MQHKSFCSSSVQEIIYCIVIYFFDFVIFFLNHWMGEILEKKTILNSVMDKLNFILQPLLCLLITGYQMTASWGRCDRCASIIPPSQVGA